MKLVSFVAGSAADALAEIQRRLGPDAVVVSVRPVSFWNISRLWRKNCKIEVTAGVPDKTSAPKPDTFSPPGQIPESAGGFASGDSRWRSVTWLEAMGLLPVHAERLQMHLRAVHGEAPPEPLEEEWQVVSRALSHFWLKPPPIDGGAEPRPHVFIGPPGSGKTTAQMADAGLAAGGARRARLAAGRQHRQHGGISGAALRDARRAAGAFLVEPGNRR